MNAEPIVLIGPGSEWFWVMAQFIALAGTGIAIYRQLRAQRSASLFEQLHAWNREFYEQRMVQVKLALLEAIRDRDPALGLPREDDEVPDFFERIGYLCYRGHVDAEDFWEDSRPLVSFYWGVLAPYIATARKAEPQAYRWFEWLELEMRRLDVRHSGAERRFDPATRVAAIDDRISIFRAKLERDRAVASQPSTERPR